jgi:pimeloyl-ACP methyl ester carboxylesterase
MIFSGDVDATAPTFLTRRLLKEFPNADFVTIAGAGHPAIGWRPDCVPQIAAHFYATLHPGNTACAQHPA